MTTGTERSSVLGGRWKEKARSERGCGRAFQASHCIYSVTAVCLWFNISGLWQIPGKTFWGSWKSPGIFCKQEIENPDCVKLYWHTVCTFVRHLQAICTEAGLLALRERRMKVTTEDFKKAKENVLYRKNEGTPDGLYLWLAVVGFISLLFVFDCRVSVYACTVCSSLAVLKFKI